MFVRYVTRLVVQLIQTTIFTKNKQPALMSKIFDLHCHPTLKPLLLLPQNRPTPWDMIKEPAVDALKNIYDSQCNCEQMIDAGCNIACVGLMSVETEMVDRTIVKLLAGPVKYIDRQQVRHIAQVKKGATYYDLFDQEVNSVVSTPKNPHDPTDRVKFISSMAEYNEDDAHTLHLIATLEGGHGLYSPKNQKQNTSEIMADDSAIIQRITDLRNKKPVRLLYITLTHIGPNAIANHAFGIKGLRKIYFFPKGNGISSLGKKIIDICQTQSIKQPPILIDVKHLSLASRIEFYQNYATLPIVASHVAVTGCSYMEKPIYKVRKKSEHDVYKVKYLKLKGHLPNTYFKPDSINLYDEDIQAILKSGGIIGLILDERVLGYQDNGHAHKEYVSAKEWNRFVSPKELAKLKEMGDDEDELDDDDEDEVDTAEDRIMTSDLATNTKKGRIQTRHLLNNLWHIIMVGDKLGIDARKHVAIGSDFDGLIDPLDNCVNVTQLDDLRMELKKQIFQFTPQIAPDIDAFLDDLFYRNGISFLKKNF